MRVEIRESAFDPWAEVQASQQALDQNGRYGACNVFVGSMRDFNQGDKVQAMHLQHYPGMTEKHLAAICAEAAGQWDIIDSLIVHRVGDISPGESIVVVAVWSAHRAEAYAASRYLIEQLKSRAPFWKQESLEQGTRWVEHNTSADTGGKG